MSDIRCIGIATGGGDAPGLNAVIRAATKTAILEHDVRVMSTKGGTDRAQREESYFFRTTLQRRQHGGSAGYRGLCSAYPPALAFFTSSISGGTMSNRFPTIA